jgi:hypothetical protein
MIQQEYTVVQTNALMNELPETRELELSSSAEHKLCRRVLHIGCPASPVLLLVMTSPRRRVLHQDGIWYLLSLTVASTGRWTSQECSSQEVDPWNMKDHKEVRPEFYIVEHSEQMEFGSDFGAYQLWESQLLLRLSPSTNTYPSGTSCKNNNSD